MNTFVLDFETTGLNPYHNEIIEVAIKKFKEEKLYNELVKPSLVHGKYVEDRIIKITGITNQDLHDKGVPQMTACENLFNFIKANSEDDKPIYLIAHNGIGFDYIFLMVLVRKYKNYAQLNNINMINLLDVYNRLVYIDSLFLSRFVIPGRYQYSQKTLCKTFNISQDNAHRAFGDVIDLEKLYIAMMMNYIYSNNMDKTLLDDTQNVYNLINSI